MKRSILKKTCSLHIGYNDGDYTNNLRGSGFELEKKENLLILHIDLSSNLKVQNKQSNTYYDIVDLLRKYQEIKLVQVLEEKILLAVGKAFIKNSETEWQMILNVGKRGCFSFKITPRCKAQSLFLDVVRG